MRGPVSMERCLDEALDEVDFVEVLDEVEEVVLVEDDLDDLALGTSRMLSMRPVVGSLTASIDGSWTQ